MLHTTQCDPRNLDNPNLLAGVQDVGPDEVGSVEKDGGVGRGSEGIRETPDDEELDKLDGCGQSGLPNRHKDSRLCADVAQLPI